MPEGPEIRHAAGRVARAVAGKVVQEAWFAFPHLKQWEERLEGRRVRSVEPRGKAMLVRFRGGLNLYSHNQLYGRWYVTRAGTRPRTGRQLRVALRTAQHSALLYSASDIDVLDDAALDEHPYLRRLGPDVLDRTVDTADVRQRLRDRRFARRSLAGLYLDQGFLGGIGNYLRSEILFVAGIDPRRRPCDLDDAAVRRLAGASLTISRRAYRTRGITNSPARAARLRAAGEPRRAYRHFVFGRAGAPCYRCGARVQKDTLAGRRIYRCPGCQGS